jgi:hypothetical protein
MWVPMWRLALRRRIRLHVPLEEGAFLIGTPNLLGERKGLKRNSRFANLPRWYNHTTPWPHPTSNAALLCLSRSYSSQESEGGGQSRAAKGSQKPEVVRNRKIISLGKQRDWKGILALYDEEPSGFDHINVATTMLQLGRIQSMNKQDLSFVRFVEDLASIIESRGLKWIGIRGITNIAHSIGKMRVKSKSAQQIIEFAARKENAQAIVLRGVPQDVANICWAMAKLGRSDIFPSFMTRVESVSQWLVDEGSPQAAANIAWACATLRFQSPKFFSEIENRSTWLVEEGNLQDVAHMAWACATLRIQSRKLFSEIENQSVWIVYEGNPQAVATIALACAKLDFQSPKLFSAIESRSSWIVKEGNPQDVANIALACAKLDFQSPKLFSAIESRSSWIVKEGNPHDVATITSAFAKLGFQSPKLFSAGDLT